MEEGYKRQHKLLGP